MQYRHIIATILFLGASTGSFHPAGRYGAPEAVICTTAAAEDWQQEMADACSRTQDAMAMSISELQSLLQRCDKLKPAIEALAESPRKVYGKRLQMCRELYRFMLETKEREAKEKH